VTPREQAIHLLARNVKPTQIAQTIGVDVSYISQLKADPEVQEMISQIGADMSAEDVKVDDLIRTGEQQALENIVSKLKFATLGQSLSAFRILNDAKKRNEEAERNAGAGNGSTVILVLPQQASANYVMNHQNEIVEVDGKTMVAASNQTVDAMLAARAAKRLIPHTTALDKAEQALETLQIPARQAPRKLPVGLNVQDL
jgi:hypothetical protein